MSTTARLANRVSWTTDETGRVVVHTRQAVRHGAAYLAVVLGVTVACGLILGSTADEGFWTGGFAAFTAGFGLFFLVGANYLVTNHQLVVDDGSVTHRWRRLVGEVREAPVAGFEIFTAPEDGESGPYTELAVRHADGTPPRGLWVGDLPELVRLGMQLHSRTGLPFDPEPHPPRPAG